MNSDHVSLIALVAIFGAGLLGIMLRRVLPAEHFIPALEAVIKLVSGFVMTMTGIILGMLVSSAKASNDGQKLLVAHMASDIIFQDRSLALYGPETDPIRIKGRQAVGAAANRVWPPNGSPPVTLHLGPGFFWRSCTKDTSLVVLCTTSASFHGRDSRVSKKRQPDASFRSEKLHIAMYSNFRLYRGLHQFRGVDVDLDLGGKPRERSPIVTSLADIQARAKHQQQVGVLHSEVSGAFTERTRAPAE